MRLLLAFAVLCGGVQAGARYFYCEAIGLSVTDPCGRTARYPSECPLESVDAPSLDCCEVIRVPAMPQGAQANERSVPPASVVAIVPASEYTATRAETRASALEFDAKRWRPPPRSSGEVRAQLMVFLT